MMLVWPWGGLQPAAAQPTGASLQISPNTGVFEVGSLVDISFVIDTGGQAVNAVNAEVTFPADKLQVVNPAASTSFISIWVTAPTYSNTAGTIRFQGGLPNPGIKTSAGVISTVTFRVKSSGQATIKYAPTSQVLRNDGQGTNILSSTGTATITLKNPPPSGPEISSSTHPDSNEWYNNPTIQLTWTATDSAVGYSFALDQNPKGTPDEVIDTTSSAASATANGDGVWYFHVRAKTEVWGGVSSYTVRIDRTPPATFAAKLDKEVITTEDTGTLRWLTTDGASGIDHYEVKQVTRNSNDPGLNTLFVETTSPYTIQPLPEGQYEFVVQAIDRAGNSTEGIAQLRVVSGGLPWLASVPILRNPAAANVALIILGIAVLGLAGLWFVRRFRIQATFRHDLNVLEKDARHKAQALQHELDEIRRAETIMHQDIGSPPPTPPISPPQP